MTEKKDTPQAEPKELRETEIDQATGGGLSIKAPDRDERRKTEQARQVTIIQDL